jgi:predicted ATPase
VVIKRIRISNFKSFEDSEIELGKFNVLIGANASGKSNFIQVFKFLRDVANYGLDNAISMQGGVEYLRNINIGSSKNFSLEVVSDLEQGAFVARTKPKARFPVRVYETTYNFVIGFIKKGPGFEIVEDKFTQKLNIFSTEEKELGRGEITISKVKEKINVDTKFPEGIGVKEDDLYPPFMKFVEPRVKGLQFQTLLELPLPFFVTAPMFVFNGIVICDFDPKLPKKATPITGKAEIEEDGSNLAIVLKNIIENKDKKRKLFNLMKDILPFVHDLDVEKFADKSLLFKLREIYMKKGQYLPASLISDGTINIAALIIALYFERKWLTIIEEPERNIHPHLIFKLVEMMKDASREKQIIVTTHNPEIVKYANLENILLMTRNKEGFSVVSKPKEKEEVRTFLENELGIEELYVQNLLE